MLRNRRESGKKVASRRILSRRSVRFPGILNDAADLNTDRVSLYLAITKKRTSKKYQELLDAYLALKGAAK